MNNIYFTHDGGKLTGFYEDGITAIPEGAVKTDSDTRDAMLAAEATGKIIVVEDGAPKAVDPPSAPSDWTGKEWKANPEMKKAMAIEMRKAAYRAETDDMIYDVLAGDIDISVWKEKKLAIKTRIPKE